MEKLERALSLRRSGGFDLLLYRVGRRLGSKNIVPTLPFSLMIEPTNACNLHCPTCPTGSGKMSRPKRMMNLHEFESIIEQVRGHVTEIALWNYGEPFLNKQLLSMVKSAVSAGLAVKISTNGDFLSSAAFCMEVVQSGLQHLIICLDGADQETLSRFRRGSRFSDIVDGLRFMHDTKASLGSKTPRIELQFIVMKHNEHQRAEVKRLAAQVGADVYCEKVVGIDCNDADFQRLAEELLPRDLSSSRYYRREDGTFTHKGDVPNSCSWVSYTSVINSDGTVVPCCYDLYSEHVMGNVFEEKLKTIWKSAKYQAFRRELRKDRRSIRMCNICPVDRYSINHKSES